jgi:UDP-N-acetylmuramoyl-tripeptide--D-alanyl-D-alanine ligase
VKLIPDQCAPGSLFVPSGFELKLGGFTSEEAALQAAIAHGASMVLTNLARLSFRPSVPVIHAPPTVAALVRMARFARADYRGKVIAITGSVGKTSTKDLVHHVLSHAGSSFKTPDNRNALGGVCEVTINRPAKSRFTVVEVGASEAGHTRHAAIARPHVGIITRVGSSHLQNYRHADDILREKIALFDHLEGERVGIVHKSVLDADDARDRLLRSKSLARLVAVSEGPDSDIFPLEAEFDGAVTVGMMSVLGKPHRFSLSLPARHFLETAMLAVGTATVLGLDVEALMPSLATAVPAKGRFMRYRITTVDGAIELLDDCYNAAPESVAALLGTLERRAARRKVLVLGDMLGLGSSSARLHEEIAPAVRRAGIGVLITVGELARLVGSGVDAETMHHADAAAASVAVPPLLRPGDLVAVKGSGAMRLDNVVEAIRSLGESAAATGWTLGQEERVETRSVPQDATG